MFRPLGRSTAAGIRAFLASLLAVETARAGAELADGRGLDLRLFRPPMDADGYLTVNGTRTLPPGFVGFQTQLDLGLRLLELDARGAGDTALIDSVTTAFVSANVGAWNGGVLGAALTFQGVGGPQRAVPGLYEDERAGEAPRSNGPGDLELHAKLRLHDLRRGPIGVAAIARVELPTGASSEFRGEPGVVIAPSLAAELQAFSIFRAGAELGYRWVGGEGARIPRSRGTLEYDDQLAFGAAAELALGARFAVVLDTYGRAILPALGDSDAFSLELALGAKYRAHDYLSVQLGGAFGPQPGIQGARARIFAGIAIAPSASDFDGDGYVTQDDGCPSAAEDFDRFEDSDGCPDLDNDADGVPDPTDDCLDDPEDRDGIDDTDGCPERAIPDSDGDGRDDYLDSDRDSPGGSP